MAKGQCESSGAFIGPKLLSRGSLSGKRNEGRNDEGVGRRRDGKKRERERASGVPQTSRRDQIFTRWFSCGFYERAVYTCACTCMYTQDRTISTNGAHESRASKRERSRRRAGVRPRTKYNRSRGNRAAQLSFPEIHYFCKESII